MEKRTNFKNQTNKNKLFAYSESSRRGGVYQFSGQQMALTNWTPQKAKLWWWQHHKCSPPFLVMKSYSALLSLLTEISECSRIKVMRVPYITQAYSFSLVSVPLLLLLLPCLFAAALTLWTVIKGPCNERTQSLFHQPLFHQCTMPSTGVNITFWLCHFPL